jgi:ribosomal protein L7/L12
MGALELFVLIAFCAAMAVFLLWATTSHSEVIQYDPTRLDREAARDRDVVQALQSGDKIRAIKAYRDLAGVTSEEAKLAVEFLTANPQFALSSKPKRLERDNPFDTGVREMVRTGKKSDAIKIYQEFTGASLTEAHNEIDRIEWEENQRSYKQNGR